MTTNLTLTDISEAQKRLLDMDLDDDSLQQFLDGVEGQAHDKIMRIVHVIHELEAQAKTIEDRIAAIRPRMNTRMARAGFLRQYLLKNMDSMKIKKVESPEAMVWLQDSPPSVEADMDKVPHEYIRVTLQTLLSEVPESMIDAIKSRMIDAQSILALHKAKSKLPAGVTIIDDKQHLRIKP